MSGGTCTYIHHRGQFSAVTVGVYGYVGAVLRGVAIVKDSEVLAQKTRPDTMESENKMKCLFSYNTQIQYSNSKQ
jgi:hypothetical protein